MHVECFIFVFSSIFIYLSTANVLYVQGELGKITHVYMDPCDATPCIFHKGNNGTITISFIPNTEISSVKASVHGIISGIPLPFPIEGDDGCKDSGLTCPLKDGVEVTYFKALEVMKQYPSVSYLLFVDYF